MVKVGRLIKPVQQLCYAHGIQLAVVDVLYKQNYSLSKALNEEMSVQNKAVDEGTDENHESDLANENLDNDEDCSFDLSFPTSGKTNLDMKLVIRKLENLNKSLAQKLVVWLRDRIAERTKFMHDETFDLPSKNVIRKEIKTIVERLEFKENYVKNTATADDSEEDVPLANLESNSAVLAVPMSLQEKLDQFENF
ncbi:hypothetical protein ILUMI_13419 [Ignelater luminosus]|uniref:Uncharacterized protein n=1 Tax=Ignelater luminosus TaxID=2038154 RepID=A0A8K0G5U6_IGNLU|nr:hypothetical protein ILUMI_13419 [Ignelater luminosus]